MTRQAGKDVGATFTPSDTAPAPLTFPPEPARQALIALARRRSLSVMRLTVDIHLDLDTARSVFLRRRLPWDHADHIAIALGRHPSELWPDWFGPVMCEPGDDSENAGRDAAPRSSSKALLVRGEEVGLDG
jgi:lambda repressor-like predicted transcriptional regulator